MQKMSLTKKSSYWYDLPAEFIAQHPKDKRSESRMLVLDKKSGKIQHEKFNKIIDHLKPSDIIVVNNTKVIPARLFGNKSTGAKVEVFLLEQKTENCWECLVKPGRKLQIGAEIIFNEKFKAKIIDHAEEGGRIVEFYWEGNFWDILEEIGNVPLPPYIRRESTNKDKETYQTVYAEERGSVAAPTARLHFTKPLMKQIREKGIEILEVVLHVGLGTFRPVKTDDMKDHTMHREHCMITNDVASKINEAKIDGRRI
ncbi:MAG: tRNA preQ1(34) S-adenosylmethionine ribosyltransferase-isomerase QueA, partial [Candidatus Cloacimonetes bacterium]|nr:tRNA preQ1(34) S-adenosylmethionine ribosyltransferase-isomerase QueA [Candidatus Cloacimonadota bacterium]